MALHYRSLDPRTREFMSEELKLDVAGNQLHISERLNTEGEQTWPALLGYAITVHDDAWLAKEIKHRGLLKSHEEGRTPTGGTTTAKMPMSAPYTLAEAEFNRFYIRGLCAHAQKDGIAHVEVYRARPSDNPRPESERIIGKRLDPSALLNDLRAAADVDTALGIPPGPNSGLSVFIP